MESILFVDDEINILNSLKRGLIDEEFDCYFASSGKEALEVLEKKPISVIVTDMRMPGMDGLTLLKEVKEKYPKTVRIVLSGYTQLQQILATINQVDIFKFITKPWKMEDEFKVVINQAIEYYKLQVESERLTKELEHRNIAYQNILKNIEDIIASAKKSREVIGMYGKLILKYTTQTILDHKEDVNYILEIQDKILDYFIEASDVNIKEFQSEIFLDEMFERINRYIKIAKCEKRLENENTINASREIAEAILLSSILTFENEFTSCGLDIIGSNNQNINLSISMISPNAYNIKGENAAIIDLKTDFLNSVLGEISNLTNMSFSVTKTNSDIMIVLTFND